MKVLLVESGREQAVRFLNAFKQQGWESTVAVDAPTALAQARKSPPTAVILATQLPAGGAMITLRRLRASASTAASAVIMVGEASEEERRAFLDGGAQLHLPADVDVDVLCTELRRQLQAPPEVAEAPPAVLQDPVRMAALRASGLLDTPPDASFDRITHLVSRLLDAPTALFSVVDGHRQFFKSQIGLSEPWASQRETPLSHSFCQWVVSGCEPVMVNDASKHPLLSRNLAVRDLGVMAYTGVPVSTLQGQALGSLCAIDARPREWSQKELATLRDLASLAESCIAHAALVHQPPQRPDDLDHYAEATGAAIRGALGILRRDYEKLARAEREMLYDLIDEYGQHLVQINRLIQVNQAIR